jgi:ABC-type lipoprotein export system ATPase subunit
MNTEKVISAVDLVKVYRRGAEEVRAVNGVSFEAAAGEMVAIVARALINNPKVLLADEPTGSLDSRRTEEIKGILRDLTKQGITVVMVTHNLDLARSADRLLEIRDGKIHG